MPSSPHIDDIPAGPPPEVLAEVDAAWERAQAPLARDLLLHFELDPLTRRVHGELRTPDGAVRQRVSAHEALLIACGDALVQREPALAA